MPTHKAAVLYGAKDLRIESVETHTPTAHEVQIRPRATGICGTDQHYYQNDRNGIYTVTSPLILGHEYVGEVVAVGSAVTHLKTGDRVVVEPQIACTSCLDCRKDRYNLCQWMRFNGSASASPPPQGSLQTRLNYPAFLCYKLPDAVSFEEAAMVEPLAVAVHSVHKAAPEAGQSVLITGEGAIGLFCARMAKISGASLAVMGAEMSARMAQEVRRAMSSSSGPSEEEDNTTTAIAGADYTLECTGVEALELALRRPPDLIKCLLVTSGDA